MNYVKKLFRKLALCSLSIHLNNYQKKVIFNSILKDQFNYCPIEWMFCSRTSNNMINKLHERSLKIALNDYSSDFNELLENNNKICNHHRNVQTLLIKVFKMKTGLSPPILESMLNRRVNTYTYIGTYIRDFGPFCLKPSKKLIL